MVKEIHHVKIVKKLNLSQDVLDNALAVHQLLRYHTQNPDHRISTEVQLLRLHKSECFSVFGGETQRIETEIPRVVVLLEISHTRDRTDGPPALKDSSALDEGHERERCHPEYGERCGDLLEVEDGCSDI